MCGLILSQFLMGTFFLEMNMWCFGWHIPLGCEELVFRLTHNFWLWTCFVHPFVHLFFHPFNPFIHFSFPSIFIFNHWTHGKIFFHIMQYFVPCVNKIFQKKFDYAHMLMFTHSLNNNPWVRPILIMTLT